MNHHKKAIIQHIENLPLGGTVILPSAKFILRYPRYLFYILMKWLAEKREVDYLLKRLRTDDFSEVVIVYDLSVSPQNYGVVFYMAMFAKYFLLKGKHLAVVIINSEFRDDWEVLNEAEKASLVDNFLELPRILLGNGAVADIRLMTWKQFAVYFENNKTALIPFKNRVLSRESIYPFVFNIINHLVSLEDADFIDRFLLSYDNIISKVKVSRPEKPYITWQARFSDKWAINRNCSEDEFIKIYASLKTLYPNHFIMLVSDQIGCEYFKRLSNKHNFMLLFSKDFSITFMGDVALILGSDYYFQLRGGGIAAAVIYSKIPYGMIYKIDHEKECRKGKLAPWSTNKQIIKVGTIGVPDDVRT